MVKILLSLIVFAFTSSSEETLYTLEMPDLGGKKVSMSDYKDKTLLFVNTASSCGYTPQLSDLEKLYQKYKDSGLVILGFPSNDFKQEGLSGAEIKKFCKLNYGVTFPLFKKSSVSGDKKNDVYKHLLGELDDSRIGWNFEKILVSKNGQVLKKYKSAESPLGGDLEKHIQKLLKKKDKES